MLVEWGLKSKDTPRAGNFPDSGAEVQEARMKVENAYVYGNPRPTFPFQDRAKRFMETSSANTFVVSFEFFSGDHYDAHALLAVRRDNGSIVYIDLQTVPPSIHDDLDPRCNGVHVTPTNVDWRVNRQLRNVVDNGVHVPLLTVGNGAGDFFEDGFFGDLLVTPARL